MLKNKWFWCALAAVILIIAFIFVFISCSESGGDASEFSVIVSAGGEFSCLQEPSFSEISAESVPENSMEISEISTYEEISIPSATSEDIMQESHTESSAQSEAESSVPEVSYPEPVLVTLPVITLPSDFSLPWDGSVAHSFERGSGTANDPYIISTPSQLAYFRDSVNNGNSFSGEYVRLEANILITDISAETPTEWQSIGNTKNPFCGTFDGGNHVISGLYGGGLFGYIRGSVKNLGIADSYITHGGGIAETASRDFSSDTVPVIENCYITRSTVNGSGGITGYAGGYDIIGCVNDAVVSGTDDWVGGVVGQLAMGSMKNCFNFGVVDTESFCGGVVGNAFNSRFEYCFNICKVDCDSECGSFAAVSYDAIFTDCGVLEGTAEYILYLSDITPQTEVEGIEVLTKDKFS